MLKCCVLALRKKMDSFNFLLLLNALGFPLNCLFHCYCSRCLAKIDKNKLSSKNWDKVKGMSSGSQELSCGQARFMWVRVFWNKALDYGFCTLVASISCMWNCHLSHNKQVVIWNGCYDILLLSVDGMLTSRILEKDVRLMWNIHHCLYLYVKIWVVWSDGCIDLMNIKM